MRRLTGPIRPYDWGSHEVIARVQGRLVPADGPEAELWLGAHPADPATVDGQRLDDVILADPDGQLGAAVVRRFGGRLPFLLKLLAAERPLSLQVHPNSTQALAGFQAEEAAGIDRDAPERRYKDASHKPELLVAIEPTEALCGFAGLADTADFLDSLDWKAGKPWADRLRAGALRDVVAEMLALSREEASAPVADLVAAGTNAGSPRALAIADLATRYPGDPGVLVALLLNHVRLEPGEGIYLGAGSPHAYLRGAGVEIMAASDNVLRGGLTSKFVDAEELLKVLAFDPGPAPVVRAESLGPGVHRWPTPTAEFALSEVDIEGADVALPGTGGPRVLLCLEGEVALSARDEMTLKGGEAAWSPASDPELTAAGTGRLFVGTTGQF